MTPNSQPAFVQQEVTGTFVADGVWRKVATLRALDSDVPPNWSDDTQDSLQWRSVSTNSNVAPSQIRNSRHLAAPGGGMDADIWLLPVSAGEVRITVDVKDRRGGTATITIGPFTIVPDPDVAPTVCVTDVTVAEGESAVVTITSSVGGGSGTVQFATANGTATAGSDYRSSSGQHSFTGPGTRTVTINTIDDTVDEDDETFTVTLSAASGVSIGCASATVTIVDNDTAATVSISGATVTEGEDAVLAVAVSGGPVGGSVTYATVADGTATAGSDYTTTTGTLPFTTTKQTGTVTVPTTDDSDVESTETLTVRLLSAAGMTIATADATVNILDNDNPTPDPCPEGTSGTPPDCVPDTCPVGQSGTPPNCVPDTCPVGQSGTPPNCTPTVVATGCDAASRRLSALTVTAGGTSVLSGFSATTYSYSVTVIGERNVTVAATAADSSATVSIYGSRASAGSASVSLSLPSYSTTITTTVAHSGDTCAYTTTVAYQAAPLTECPAYSGQMLVNGVCVPACSSNSRTTFDSEGQVSACLPLGDCPYDLYGLSGPPGLTSTRDYNPLWVDGLDTFDAVAPGGTASLTRTAVKCLHQWRVDPFTWPNWVTDHHCLINEVNLKAVGDCLQITLSVEAVIPAVEADTTLRYWSYKSSGCGNKSAPRAESTSDPWEAADAVCASTEGAWAKSCYSCAGTSPTAPTQNAGTWSVSVVDDELSARGDAYVDVPLQVSVTDWGDASHLEVTVTATKRDANWYYNGVGDWGYTASWGTSVTTRLTVPRRSGPAPSDDVIEVQVSDVDDLPYSIRYDASQYNRYRGTNEQFVEILRSELLANDACPVGLDCSDPLQWPVWITQEDPSGTESAERCVGLAFRYQWGIEFVRWTGTRWITRRVPRSMLPTDQGLVGCDNLNGAARTVSGITQAAQSAVYWPRLWATGEDTFRYSTYGGEATVTIRFADQVPSGVTPVTFVDPGHTLKEANFPWTAQNYRCAERYNYYPYSCRRHAWFHTYTRDDTTITDASHHSGVVSLPVPTDADGDYAGTRLATAAANAVVEGRYSIRAEMMSSLSAGTDFFTEVHDAKGGYGNSLSNVCGLWGSGIYGSYCRVTYTVALGGRHSCTSWTSGGHCRRESKADAQTRRLSYIQTHRGSCETRTSFTTTSYYSQGADRFIPVAGQTECVPADVFACSSDLAEHAVCYSVKRLADQPTTWTIPYIACDDRYFHPRADRAAFAEHVAPLIASSAPGLTVTQVEQVISQRLYGNSRRPTGWSWLTDDDWNALAAATDTQVHSRACSKGTVTVLLGGTEPSVSVGTGTAAATEGQRLEFPVTLDAPTAVDVEVTHSITTVTASLSDIDLDSDPGCQAARFPITIPAGDTEATISICTTQDIIDEPDETLRVTLTSADLATIGSAANAFGVIIDDDEAPAVSISDASAAEGDGTMEFTVSLSAATGTDVTVDVATFSAAAYITARDKLADYISRTFGSGFRTESWYHAAYIQEAGRFRTEASLDSRIPLGEAPDAASFRQALPGTAEAIKDAIDTLAVTAGLPQAVINAPATPGTDYTTVTRTVTMTAGALEATVSVPITDDTDQEPDELFTMELSNPTNASLGTATATGTITDNNRPPPIYR